MATSPVRFDFLTDLQGTLKFVHNVPRSLITPNLQITQHDPGYIRKFVSTIQPIMKEHQAICLVASDPKCQSCGSPTTEILQTPMSWLHRVEKPFVNVLVNPICGKKECEIRVRQQIQDMMAEITGDVQVQAGLKGPANSIEILPCKVCGEPEKTMRCAQCKVVAYCGKEHQKADWKGHKKVCAPKSR